MDPDRSDSSEEHNQAPDYFAILEKLGSVFVLNMMTCFQQGAAVSHVEAEELRFFLLESLFLEASMFICFPPVCVYRQ